MRATARTHHLAYFMRRLYAAPRRRLNAPIPSFIRISTGSNIILAIANKHHACLDVSPSWRERGNAEAAGGILFDN